MLKSVQVPAAFEPPFAAAEQYVEKLFQRVDRKPEQGTIHVGGERYVLMRCDSLYVSWFESMADAFGKEAARGFIYNTAREIGSSDARAFCEAMHVTNGIERLSAGPVHFAHAGWARVDICADSTPATDEKYYLHYFHPNTFEAEVLKRRGKSSAPDCACLFSAGYSSGWCSEAFGIEVHGREIACTARGDKRCEFVMAPHHLLDAAEKRARTP